MNQFELAISQIPDQNQVEIRKSVEVFLKEADDYRKIIESIEVKDINDSESVKNAREARLFLKRRRGEAKDFTQSKRDEIKKAKLHYDLMDTAYLKTFQFIESTYKEIEEIAQQKEDYVKILEAQQKEETRKKRWEELSKYMDTEPIMLAEMTDQVFELTLKGAKADHEARIEAERKAEEERLEKERIKELVSKREKSIAPVYSFFEVPAMQELATLTEEQFNQKLSEAFKAKSDHEAEQEKIRLENERLKKEREAEQARLAKEAEERKAKEEAEAKKRAIEEAKKQAELDKIKAELEAERKRKLDEEIKKQKEEEDRIKAEEEARKAPDKDKILKVIDDLSLPVLELKEYKNEYNEIVSKFSSFKTWAKNQIK